MRRVLVAAALALAAVAAVATLKLTLLDAYNTQYIYLYAKMDKGYEEYTDAPRGVWLGPYNNTDITLTGGTSLVFYVAFLNIPAGNWYEIDINYAYRIYINSTFEHISTPVYKIKLVARNATHYIYRVEVKLPDVWGLYIRSDLVPPGYTTRPAKANIWYKFP